MLPGGPRAPSLRSPPQPALAALLRPLPVRPRPLSPVPPPLLGTSRRQGPTGHTSDSSLPPSQDTCPRTTCWSPPRTPLLPAPSPGRSGEFRAGAEEEPPNQGTDGSFASCCHLKSGCWFPNLGASTLQVSDQGVPGHAPHGRGCRGEVRRALVPRWGAQSSPPAVDTLIC